MENKFIVILVIVFIIGLFLGSLTFTGNIAKKVSPETSNLVYLDNGIVRVGLDLNWGGSIIEFYYQGKQFVNHFDAGREVQASLYDGSQSYISWDGPNAIWGWNPVQAGDKYSHGSPVLNSNIGIDSIYTKTQPLEWNPDGKGGGSNSGVLSDVYVEQTVSFVPEDPNMIKIHYRIEHFGNDYHTEGGQEFPAIFVNQEINKFAVYERTLPWEYDEVSIVSAGATHYASELWGGYMDASNIGLFVFIPTALPFIITTSNPGSGGPTGTGLNYFQIQQLFAFNPGSILEGDVYLVAGTLEQARQKIYELRFRLGNPVLVHDPVGALELVHFSSGTALANGWALDPDDQSNVIPVHMYIDGVFVAATDANLPHADLNYPGDHGFQFSIPSQYLDGQVHNVYVYAINIFGSGVNVLLSEPQNFAFIPTGCPVSARLSEVEKIVNGVATTYTLGGGNAVRLEDNPMSYLKILVPSSNSRCQVSSISVYAWREGGSQGDDAALSLFEATDYSLGRLWGEYCDITAGTYNFINPNSKLAINGDYLRLYPYCSRGSDFTWVSDVILYYKDVSSGGSSTTSSEPTNPTKDPIKRKLQTIE